MRASATSSSSRGLSGVDRATVARMYCSTVTLFGWNGNGRAHSTHVSRVQYSLNWGSVHVYSLSYEMKSQLMSSCFPEKSSIPSCHA